MRRANLKLLLLLWLLALSCAAPAYGQQTRSRSGSTTDQMDSLDSPDSSDSSLSRDSTSGRSSRSTADSVLTAKQILAILREKPEVVVDLKKLMAEELQSEGFTIQDDAITDKMLFNGITTNRELRVTITDWLRTRGYLPEDEMSHFLRDGGDADDDASTMLHRDEDADDLDLLAPARSGQRSQREKDPLLSPDDTLPEDALLMARSRSADDRTALDEKLGNRKSSTLRDSKDGDSREAKLGTAAKSEPKPAAEPEILRRPAPYNLQSLRDLYTQVPEQNKKLKRFGSDVFLTRGPASKQMPLDLPVGPGYVLGAGDGLTIDLWGGLSQSFSRVVDREGKIVLPEAGTLVVAGQTMESAEALIQHALAVQYRDAHVAVTIAHLRTVRVYVVGDVQRPGAYDISSLSTPLNALYAAGGPTAVGSLRTVRHYRGQTLLREVDLYDFLLHGVRADVERLEAGDTILVPAAGAQVAVGGMVKRPAIYELQGSATLADLLEDAGGTQITAALSQITIERVGEKERRETVHFNLPADDDAETIAKAMRAFHVQDGDRIMVAPILPYSEKAIYMEGHVARPGRYPWHDGMSLSDVVRTYQDLLPEPAERAEIIRLDPPEMRPETIEFSVTDLLAGNVQLHLQPFDTVRVLGRYESDAPRVTIRGEVLHPGVYALSQQMTAAQLVRMAGGFKRSALQENADLASYEVQDGRQVISKRTTLKIGLAVKNERSDEDAILKPGDVLTIHQVSGWNDIGASIKLTGEVTYPGTYGLQNGERLSSVLCRAGGFRPSAYPAGALLTRIQVKDLEEKSRTELIHQIETTSAAARLEPSASGGDQAGTLQLLIQQQDQVLHRLRSQPVSGRLVIKISADIDSWANTPADIEVRAGDVLNIPKRPSFVLVNGQVYNTSAIAFVPGKTAGWYLRRAGGTTDLANGKEVFIIRANGLVVGRRSNEWFSGDVLSQRLDPGDIVVVPQKIVGGSQLWKNLLTVGQILSSVAIAAVFAAGV